MRRLLARVGLTSLTSTASMAGLCTAGMCAVFIHYLSHLFDGTHGDEPLMYAGAALLVLGALIDWRVGRVVKRPVKVT